MTADPREQLTEDLWDRIYPALVNKNGTLVRDVLREARKSDRGAFNDLYWRVNGWMFSYLARLPMTEAEETRFTKRDIGELRFSAFLKGKITGDHWQTADLPRLLAELDSA